MDASNPSANILLSPVRASVPFVVGGIGAAAGGIQALETFFSKVPPHTGVSFIIVLDLSADHCNQLKDALQQITPIPVQQVTEKVRLIPDHIYLVAPNKHVVMSDDTIVVSSNMTLEDTRAPVDTFFRTLAASHKSHAVGVVLSGEGANGSMGLKQIKEAGGIVFVQSPSEAAFDEMPHHALGTYLVDEVLPVEDIPAAILAYQRNIKKIFLDEKDAAEDDGMTSLKTILAQLRMHTRQDFSNYKQSILLRHIRRRMQVKNITDIAAYARYIKQFPTENGALMKDLLISVTNFLRDKPAFDIIEREVLPLIFKSKTAGDTVRIWVAGCATGEEAYSFAMLCAEECKRLKEPLKIQIFATDLDDHAISTARQGVYTINDAADVSASRLRRFFTQDGNNYKVNKEIREMLLFATHNFIKDPAFSQLDLISCRNILTYINHTAQQKVFEKFYVALNNPGFLFLGNTESVDTRSNLYQAYNSKQHLYRRRDTTLQPYVASQNAMFTHPVIQSGDINTANSQPQMWLASEQPILPKEVLNANNDEWNEKIRSAAEALEIGKEELQSLNEMLKNVNNKLKIKIEEATLASDNFSNLANATHIRSIFLDRDLRIAMFTPTVADIFNLVPADYGRPLSDITHNLYYERLLEDAHHVLNTLEIVEQEVETTDSRIFMMRMLPYRTADNSINGVVLTFIDITERKASEQTKVNEAKLKLFISATADGVYTMSADWTEMRNLKGMYFISNPVIPCKNWMEKYVPPGERQKVSEAIAQAIASKSAFELEHRFYKVDGSVGWTASRAIPIMNEQNEVTEWLGSASDITMRKHIEENLISSEEKFRLLNDSNFICLIFFNAAGLITGANAAFLQMTSYNSAQLLEQPFYLEKLTTPQWIPQVRSALETLEKDGVCQPFQKELVTRDGIRKWVLFSAAKFEDRHDGLGFFVDITALKTP